MSHGDWERDLNKMSTCSISQFLTVATLSPGFDEVTIKARSP